jgi:glycosyltransferase involved in cell wall biosynthesis
LAGGVDRARRPLPYEIVFVDDGNTDASVQLATRYARDDYRIKLVQLARNYGKEAAVTAAIEHAEGDLMLMMDPDLQDPPEHILDFVATMGFTCWSAVSSSAISCSAGPL